MNKRSLLHLALFVLLTVELSAQAGVLDSTFNQDGIDFLDLGSNKFDIAFAGVLQPDGKILVGGWTTENASADFAVVRYMEDGELDLDFGVNGIAIFDNLGDADRANALIMQPDGKIIMAGESEQGNEGDLSILRLMPDGSRDSTFGQFGWVTTDLGTSYETIMAVALQADGKIVVAGRVADGNFSNFCLLRYETDGKVDSFFGNSGVVITNFREEDAASSVLVKPDGKIIVGGFSSVSAIGDFALAGYNPDGTLDKNFGNGGKVLTDIDGQQRSDYIAAMTLLPDGKILAAGTANNSNLAFTSDIGLARYDGLGNLDETFGTEGTYSRSFGLRSSIDGMSIQVDGKIVVCGKSDMVGGENRWLLARMMPNGGLDTTFANQGTTTLAVGGLSSAAQDISIQPDGKILIVGIAGQSPDVNFGIARYKTDFSVLHSAQAVTCYDGIDGSLMVEVEGGTPPYSYSLDNINFQPDPIFPNLSAGAYLVWIQDDGGNSMAVGPILVEQPEMANVELIVSDNDVTVNVISGGVPPYVYSIDAGPFVSNNVFENLPDGVHTFSVEDALGCIIFTGDQEVMSTSIFHLEQSIPLSVYPNPSNGVLWINVGLLLNEPVYVDVYDVSGRIISRERAVIPTNGSFPMELNNLQNGCYLISIKDSMRFGTARVIIKK